jgi:hypothetical protein
MKENKNPITNTEQALAFLETKEYFILAEHPGVLFQYDSIGDGKVALKKYTYPDRTVMPMTKSTEKDKMVEYIETEYFDIMDVFNALINGDYAGVSMQDLDVSSPTIFEQIGEAIKKKLSHLDVCESTGCGIMHIQEVEELLQAAKNVYFHKKVYKSGSIDDILRDILGDN